MAPRRACDTLPRGAAATVATGARVNTHALLVSVADDLFDLLLDLRRDFPRDFLSLHVFGDLFDARRAGDNRAYVRVLQNPRDGQLTDRAAEFVRHIAEPADNVVLAGIRQLLAQPVVALQLRAAVGRYAVTIFAGQQARGKRAPRRKAETDVFV